KYNKLDLIDALPASSLAVKFDAPIVLATDKISDSQIKVLKDNVDSKGLSIYQIGYGVAESVINTIAEKVGLKK
uniref:cell wall-binding repeat-containing protein n=1 Tax=Peptacetobacter sp. TaxID=2991975 RepID=UPI003FA71DD8